MSTQARATGFSIGAIILVVMAAHLTLIPKIADLDGFYHVGHAAAYAEGSIFDTSLPWATKSIIADRGADMWWGFHLVLMPFTFFNDIADGVRVAAVSLTLIFALGMFWMLRRHGVVEAGAWSAVFLVAVPNVLYQYLAVRPQVLTMLAALLLLSVLCRGRWWQAGLLATLITWLHLGFFWMAPGIVCAYAMVRIGGMFAGDDRAENDARVPVTFGVSAVFLGTVLGWLLRPHPIEAGMLANVQIVRLFMEKMSTGAMLYASELSPLGWLGVADTSWAFLGLWLAAGGYILLRLTRDRLRSVRPEERTLMLTALAISTVFLALAVFSARRAQIQWVTFGFVLLPLTWTWLMDAETRKGMRGLMAAALLVNLGWAGRRHTRNVELVAFPGNSLAEVAAFLEQNSEPGEVVFHTRWDNFGPLFARNRRNHYLGGMDPIFQLAHEPRFFWEYFYLSSDTDAHWTCDAFPCPTGVVWDTHEAIRDHFAARWVLVEPLRNPRFALYLLNDPRYRLAFDTQHEAVFEVLPGYPPGTEPALIPADDISLPADTVRAGPVG